MNTKELIQNLRENTGAGINACAQALKDSNNDLEKATNLLKERGHLSRRNNGTKETKAGAIGIYQHHNKQIGAMVTLKSETDFVARMPRFIEFANELAQHVAAMNPSCLEQFLKQEFILKPENTIEQLLSTISNSCEEKIVITSFIRFEI